MIESKKSFEQPKEKLNFNILDFLSSLEDIDDGDIDSFKKKYWKTFRSYLTN